MLSRSRWTAQLQPFGSRAAVSPVLGSHADCLCGVIEPLALSQLWLQSHHGQKCPLLLDPGSPCRGHWRQYQGFSDAERRSEQIGREVRADVQVSRVTVVMACERLHLPQLALGLGWSQVPLVRDDDFDGIWLLRYSGSPAEPEVTMLSQSQLRHQKCFHSAGLGGHPLQ